MYYHCRQLRLALGQDRPDTRGTEQVLPDTRGTEQVLPDTRGTEQVLPDTRGTEQVLQVPHCASCEPPEGTGSVCGDVGDEGGEMSPVAATWTASDCSDQCFSRQ